MSNDAIDGPPEADEFEQHSRGPWARAVRRFLRRPLGVAALAVFTAIVVTGLLGRHVATYAENEIDLTHVNQPSGPTLAGHHHFGTDYLGRDPAV
jgi:ABC-type dipeptide/oligopeptide/nickel transport system permease subunit